MVGRTFTLEQAHALIPWLSEIFGDQQSDIFELLTWRGQGARSDYTERLERRIQARLRAVSALGLEVQRVDGVVDIPSVRDGHPVWLTWRLGDEAIHRWRPADGGETALAGAS